MELNEIVQKLIGSVHPVGESNTDKKRLENLKVMCKLVEKLLDEIQSVSIQNSKSHEFSVKESGMLAKTFISFISNKDNW